MATPEQWCTGEFQPQNRTRPDNYYGMYALTGFTKLRG